MHYRKGVSYDLAEPRYTARPNHRLEADAQKCARLKRTTFGVTEMKSDHACEFLCATCGLLVAGPLVPLGDESLLCREDGRDYLPTGYFAISDGEYYTGTEGQVLLNLTDLRNTKRHPDPHRLNGAADSMDAMAATACA